MSLLFIKTIIVLGLGSAFNYGPFINRFNSNLNEEESNVSEIEDIEEEASDFLNLGTVGTGVGLLAVGGVGAGIIAHNNKKPKDVPSKEIPYEDKEE